MSVSVLARNTCTSLGEGPHWDESSQSLLYVDISAKEIHKFNYETSQDVKVDVPENVGFVIPNKQGELVIGQERKICLYNWDAQQIQKTFCEAAPRGANDRFNDAKCDASGRLWAGTMGAELRPAEPELGKGCLFSLDSDGQFQQHLENIDISNGLAWTRDNSIMYYIDSIPRKVYAFDYDIKDGKLANQRVVVDFAAKDTDTRKGFPDGMCIDQEGKLWVACYAGAKVVRFDPETGQEMQHVDIPALRVTSCCFGGKNYDELLVTCAVAGASDDELKKYPLSGSVFKVSGLGVKGMPPAQFAG